MDNLNLSDIAGFQWKMKRVWIIEITFIGSLLLSMLGSVNPELDLLETIQTYNRSPSKLNERELQTVTEYCKRNRCTSEYIDSKVAQLREKAKSSSYYSVSALGGSLEWKIWRPLIISIGGIIILVVFVVQQSMYLRKAVSVTKSVLKQPLETGERRMWAEYAVNHLDYYSIGMPSKSNRVLGIVFVTIMQGLPFFIIVISMSVDQVIWLLDSPYPISNWIWILFCTVNVFFAIAALCLTVTVLILENQIHGWVRALVTASVINLE